MPRRILHVRRQLLVSLIAFQLLLGQDANSQKTGTEILWDTYGVPHIYGRSISEMYFGFGWAQMHNHGNLVLRLYGQARGRAAEYWGSSYYISDKLIRLFDIPSRAEADYAAQDPTYKKYLDAFVEGINAYVRAHPESINEDNRIVLPVTARDVLAHCARTLFLKFVAEDDIAITARLIQPGSNSYAVGPARTTSKKAMLVANPHLAWSDLYTFFEAQLQGPGFSAYGVSLIGLPVLSIAFNQHLGWTHTVNPVDVSDRYELKLKNGGYQLDDSVVPFENRLAIIKVRRADGGFDQRTDTFRYSRQGPVIGVRKDNAYAVRIAGLDRHDLLYQWHRMAQSNNWEAFETALKMMQLPMFNVMYADAGGNIAYLYAGTIPKRSEGDWWFWHGTVDGSRSKYIWNSILPYDSLPKLKNPRSGFLQNANDPPWSCTYPEELAPGKFPAYISPDGMFLRPQRAVSMIRNDSAITFEKMIVYKENTEMEAADRFLNDLLVAVDQYPDSMAQKAASVLRNWDRTTDAASRGSVLFSRWFDKMTDTMYVRSWSREAPLETPSGLKYPKRAVELLVKASGEVIRDFDSLNVAWGDVYRFRINNTDLPAAGAAGKYGAFRTFYYARDKDKKYRAIAGDTYVAVIEFGKSTNARVLLSYGNSSQPGSKHMEDQLSLLSQKKLRPAWIRRTDVLDHLETSEQLNISIK